MTHCPLVIVGAGPAGLSAASTTAEAGIPTLLIDENPRIGGQIFRQPAAATDEAPDPQKAELFRRFQAAGSKIESRLGTTVWGLFPPGQLALLHDGQSALLRADNIILTPGAHEYVPPFPGWTLPGVMTPGAAQILVKSMNVSPGKRVLLAGTGPFLLVVAQTLHHAGTRVVGIIEMARRRESWRVLPGLLACPGLLKEGIGYLARLKRAGIPIHRGQVLVEARGDEQVQEAVFAPCNADGSPDRARSKSISVDAICVGYGFVPRVQLAQLAGCRLHFDDAQGGWRPATDENQQTSQTNVWSAGDGAGVAGALVAQLEGTLAGLAVARRLDALADAEFRARRQSIARRLARLRRFRAALDWLYRLRPALTDLAAPETVVCRCEEVTRAEVETAIDAGGVEYRTLKTMTRAGMGPCQGMMCGPALCRFLAARAGKPIERIGPPSVRPPIVPVGLGTLAEASALSARMGATS
ncbi:MAG: FAD-dependent oxidoreductase [Planctomycetes bacterium]|nr:FAD-dependent oxidoreductase [Planctomycetota bacterium]